MLKRSAKRAIRHLVKQRFSPLNRITLSRQAALHNLNLFQELNPGKGIIPVLKANAYGHGLGQMSEILNGFPCDFLAVDGYFEATAIRYVTHHPILVMGYIKPENMRHLDTKHCSFVVQDIAGLEAFKSLKRPVKIHVELNTGMNRLGLLPSELDDYLDCFSQLSKRSKLVLEGVMSHLADADNEADDSFTNRQVELFDRQVEHIKARGFTPRYIHLAQTAGSTKAASKYANALRIGIGVYGLNPLGARDKNYHKLHDLRPVLSFKSTIIKVLELKAGDRVSYNGTFTAKKPMKIGVLPLGYYEGLPRALSNAGAVVYGTKQLPIVGRVCMNHTMINLEGADITVGSEVTVISDDPSQPNSIDQICQDHRLFNYSFATGLASTTRRIIVQ